MFISVCSSCKAHSEPCNQKVVRPNDWSAITVAFSGLARSTDITLLFCPDCSEKHRLPEVAELAKNNMTPDTDPLVALLEEIKDMIVEEVTEQLQE